MRKSMWNIAALYFLYQGIIYTWPAISIVFSTFSEELEYTLYQTDSKAFLGCIFGYVFFYVSWKIKNKLEE